MSRNIWLIFVIRLVVVLFLQMFVLNYYEWLGSYVACVLLYALLILPIPLPWYAGLIAGFLLGMIEDTFTTFQGLHAATFTFIALLRPSVIRLFLKSRNETDFVLIDTEYLGWRNWSLYLLVLVFFHAFLFFLLQYFTFTFSKKFIVDVVLQTFFNFLMILAIEGLFVVFRKRKNQW